jgi:hypothetical protein
VVPITGNVSYSILKTTEMEAIKSEGIGLCDKYRENCPEIASDIADQNNLKHIFIQNSKASSKKWIVDFTKTYLTESDEAAKIHIVS